MTASTPHPGALRRWIVIAVGIVATVAGASYVLLKVPLNYKSQGSLVLIAPAAPQAVAQRAGNIATENPLLSFSSALTVDANLILQELNTPSEKDAVARQGGTATYTATGSTDGITPLINVTTQSPVRQTASRTAQILMNEAQRLLAERQVAVGAPSDTHITMQVVTAPSTPVRSWSSRLKYLIVAIMAGITFTYLLQSAARSLAQRRFNRNGVQHEADADDDRGAPSDEGRPDLPARVGGGAPADVKADWDGWPALLATEGQLSAEMGSDARGTHPITESRP